MTSNNYLFNSEERLNLEAAKGKDSKARAFILTSITKEVKRKVHIMTKIKEHYDKYKSNDVDQYIRKLNSLKSKNINDSLENNNVGMLEKAKYINFVERFQKKKQKSKKIGEFIVIDYVEKPRHNNVKSHTIDKYGFNYNFREERRKIREMNFFQLRKNVLTKSNYCLKNKLAISNQNHKLKTIKIQMKWAKNSTCEFQGIGTFEEFTYRKLNTQRMDFTKVTKHKNNNINIIRTIEIYTAEETNIIRITIKRIDSTFNFITNQNNKNTMQDEYSTNLWHGCLGHFHHDNLAEYLDLRNIMTQCTENMSKDVLSKNDIGPQMSKFSSIIFDELNKISEVGSITTANSHTPVGIQEIRKQRKTLSSQLKTELLMAGVQVKIYKGKAVDFATLLTRSLKACCLKVTQNQSESRFSKIEAELIEVEKRMVEKKTSSQASVAKLRMIDTGKRKEVAVDHELELEKRKEDSAFHNERKSSKTSKIKEKMYHKELEEKIEKQFAENQTQRNEIERLIQLA
ncbi:hypothetical protein H8356DRAFT_1320485 [Neocallimastix lanati (nom. inval.)]|nr:hypothetical protein H8356DRAFT_1320485 [Neocallimastix sp. JGI-2020a]